MVTSAHATGGAFGHRLRRNLFCYLTYAGGFQTALLLLFIVIFIADLRSPDGVSSTGLVVFGVWAALLVLMHSWRCTLQDRTLVIGNRLRPTRVPAEDIVAAERGLVPWGGRGPGPGIVLIHADRKPTPLPGSGYLSATRAAVWIAAIDEWCRTEPPSPRSAL